jgi:hypothetical protein
VEEEKNIPCNLATPVLPDIVSISPDNMMDMEGIVSVVVVEPNGSKTSYLPEEIIWASHFADCVVYKEEEGIFMVEVGRINMMIPNCTPRMSAKKMASNQPGGCPLHCNQYSFAYRQIFVIILSIEMLDNQTFNK